MKKLIRNLFLLGVGTAATAAAVVKKDKIKKEIDELVKKGQIKADEGKEILKVVASDLKEAQKKLNKRVDEEVKKQVKKLGYVSKSVHKKVEDKNKKLEVEIAKLKDSQKTVKGKKAVKTVANAKKTVKKVAKKAVKNAKSTAKKATKKVKKTVAPKITTRSVRKKTPTKKK